MLTRMLFLFPFFLWAVGPVIALLLLLAAILVMARFLAARHRGRT